MINAVIRWFIYFITFCMCIAAFLLMPIGLKTVVYTTSKLIPGKIQYQNASGLILGPIEISDLRYQYRNIDLTIKKLRWQWDIGSVLRGEIQIHSLEAENVRLNVLSQPHVEHPINDTLLQWVKNPNASEQQWLTSLRHNISQFKKFHWPINLTIEKAQINNFIIVQQQNPTQFKIDTIKLNGELNKHSTKLFLTAHLSQPATLVINLNVLGNTNNYRFLLAASNKKFHWHLQGQGTDAQLTATLQNSQISHGTLSGNLQLVWAPDLHWNLNLISQKVDLSAVIPKWPKNVNLKLQSHGTLLDKQWDAVFVGVLTAPQNKIQLEVQFKDQWQIQWNIAANALHNLWPQTQGILNSKGSWTGILPQIKTQGLLQANNLALLQFHLDEINGKWDFDWMKQNTGALKIQATNLKQNNTTIDQLELLADGTPQSHRIQGDIQTKSTTLNWKLHGKWMDSIWSGDWTQFTVTTKSLNQWSLEKNVPFTLGPSTWNLSEFCLGSTANDRICMTTAKLNNQSWMLHVNSPQIHLEKFSDLLMDNLSFDGIVNLNADIKGDDSGLKNLQWQVNFLPGSLHYTVGSTQLKSNYEKSILSGYLDKKGLHGTFKFNLPNNDYLSADFSLPNFQHKTWRIEEKPITGNLAVDIHNIGIFSALLPYTIIPQGTLQGNFKLQGTLDKPTVQGQAHLQDGQIKIPALNITLDKVDVAMNATQNQINYLASAYSANQPINIKGNTKIALNWPTQATIEANNFLFMNTNEYVLYGSPKLTVEILDHNINLHGTVDIPKGDIKPYDFRNIVTFPQSDVVFIGKTLTAPTSPWLLTTNVTVNIGNNVNLDTTGFVGKLNGSVIITAVPQQTTVATGKVGIRNGVYTIFGTTLTIDPSSYIQFTKSPLNNPNLNLRATRSITTYSATGSQITPTRHTVGVELQGTFKSPKPYFFSSPADLQQADIISYLLFNTAANASTAGNLALLLQALAAAKPGGEGFVQATKAVNHVKQGLGFNELGVESENTLDPFGNSMNQQTAFVVGKNISNRIYIRYSRGIGKITPGLPTYVWTLSYFLTHNWSVQAYTNSLGSGGDLLYTVEMN